MRGCILTKNAASLFRLRHHPGKGPRRNLRKSFRTPSRPSLQRPQLQRRPAERRPKADALHCSPQHGNPAARRSRQSAGKRAGQPGGRPKNRNFGEKQPGIPAGAGLRPNRVTNARSAQVRSLRRAETVTETAAGPFHPRIQPSERVGIPFPGKIRYI